MMSAAKKLNENQQRGRPRVYDSTTERVAAFRAKGNRYDVYLNEEANRILRSLMDQAGLSASKVLDGVLTKKIKFSTRAISKS